MQYTELKINELDHIYAMFEDKLAYFGLKEHAFLDLKKDFPKEVLEKVDHASLSFEKELHEYFKGELKVFKTPIYLSGTDFQKSVYDILIKVPYGKTVSYNDLALELGDVKKVRALANAVGRNRHLIIVPCHRVIAKDGSLGGFSSGLDLKRALMKVENIVLTK